MNDFGCEKCIDQCECLKYRLLSIDDSFELIDDRCDSFILRFEYLEERLEKLEMVLSGGFCDTCNRPYCECTCPPVADHTEEKSKKVHYCRDDDLECFVNIKGTLSLASVKCCKTIPYIPPKEINYCPFCGYHCETKSNEV